MHYLDNAATTATSSQCIAIINNILTDCFANPSSLYSAGFASSVLLQKAREQVALALGVTLSLQAPEVIFTSSGSESNNIAVLGAALARKAWGNRIITTGYEHPSVQNTVQALAGQGFDIITINPDNQGNIDESVIINAVDKATALVCIMQVNNEIGSIINVERIAKEVKLINNRTAIHVDGVQSFGKLDFSLSGSSIDTYAISGHKFHAPKGIGALYIRKGFNLAKTIFGGDQERGIRPGTENLAFAMALGEAASTAKANLQANIKHINTLSQYLWHQLTAFNEVTINSPNWQMGIINFSINGVKSQPMLNALDAMGICVSSGSACSRGAHSHTLSAMGLDASRIDSAIRVSLASHNSIEDINALITAMNTIVPNMAKTTR